LTATISSPVQVAECETEH